MNSLKFDKFHKNCSQRFEESFLKIPEPNISSIDLIHLDSFISTGKMKIPSKKPQKTRIFHPTHLSSTSRNSSSEFLIPEKDERPRVERTHVIKTSQNLQCRDNHLTHLTSTSQNSLILPTPEGAPTPPVKKSHFKKASKKTKNAKESGICTKCKRFVQKTTSSRLIHIIQHHLPKCLMCNFCGYDCKLICSLKSHIKKVHPCRKFNYEAYTDKRLKAKDQVLSLYSECFGESVTADYLENVTKWGQPSQFQSQIESRKAQLIHEKCQPVQKDASQRGVRCSDAPLKYVKCRLCEMSVSVMNKVIHIYNHHLPNSIFCPYCSQGARIPIMIQNHIKKDHPGKPTKIGDLIDKRSDYTADVDRLGWECFRNVETRQRVKGNKPESERDNS